MHSGILETSLLGLITLGIGLFWLVGVVRELAPAERGKWLLAIGFGSGLIAFSVKIVLILTFSAFPADILNALPKREITDSQQTDEPYAALSANRNPTTRNYTWQALPPVAPYPADNPTTPEKVALGKQLFFDSRLSSDGTVSCSSCHELSPDKSGSDGLPQSIGINGEKGARNAPTVLNAAFQRVLFWDGRASSLEEQAKGPLINPIEMGMASLDAVEQRVAGIGEYQTAFAEVFGERPAITIDNIAKAIAAYERTLITPNSPYDRFVRGETGALSERQLRGMALFESTGCVLCHSGANFSSASLDSEQTALRIFPAIANARYDTAYGLTEDLGAAADLPNAGQGVWRTPTLRNISLTGPYFHNGSVDSLEEAVRIMANMQLNKTLSNRANDDTQLHWSATEQRLLASDDQTLSDSEVQDIVAFLEALTGDIDALSSP